VRTCACALWKRPDYKMPYTTASTQGYHCCWREVSAHFWRCCMPQFMRRTDSATAAAKVMTPHSTALFSTAAPSRVLRCWKCSMCGVDHATQVLCRNVALLCLSHEVMTAWTNLHAPSAGGRPRTLRPACIAYIASSPIGRSTFASPAPIIKGCMRAGGAVGSKTVTLCCYAAVQVLPVNGHAASR
jgi:hypothetical protein